ncbi:major facilitator superfamily domain-containing protein [Rhizophagus irregularis DAOM 181602=DAOM 197198]|uniref:Major facilitator superfamily domain-containing protein n=1 Tax=Rhizophagus irregularis (strain DAOM 181602 / DAOM 197198 / MUCL 43194) TaxID=747089 RepID=A0A2P4QLS8_RHIID|nr:major facilitator superfamily domain-containing protein [Rhizophagus irregularis DAOM 181602=DAOM 197198]POG78603.1 major facilitator superfamily domain-containing protein [Rhizophagus irregularis DAOM 181602=DAOM 197198]|eukprot:XP_025185469.1 major facilitator superfamily domain-containing protein [Rhizophagus irregularis DAOM 181602=DAOM 197198]
MSTSNPKSPSREDLDDTRRAALEEIDNAKFGWFHIRACLVAGIGFFTDAYDLFSINLVSAILGYTYFSSINANEVPTDIDSGLKSSAAIGTMFGQLIFGWMADRFGRKKMYGIELMIIIVTTIGSALSPKNLSIDMYTIIIVWRLILGLGIGGDYPLSAIITSEFASKKRRGAMMAAVFAMQGFGILFAGVVSLVTLLAFRPLILSNSQNLDYVWRIIIGVGIIPATIALYFRLTIPETPRFTIDVQGNVDKAAHNIKFALEQGKYIEKYEIESEYRIVIQKATWKDFIHHFGQWENGKVLLGTSVTWFAHDIAYYGIGLNNAIILEAIGYVKTEDAYQSLFNISIGNIVITLMGTIPGYWFTVFLVDSLGRKYIQLQGFALLTIIFIIIGFGYKEIITKSIPLFIILYSLSQFFQNFGPNATTFIVPGEVFPTRYRSTCHGISAASGKLGAIISQFVFLKLKDIGGKNQSVNHLFKFFGFFTFIGFLFTLLIPETKGLTLEELSNEKKIIHIDKDTKDIIIDDPTILSSRSIRKSRPWYEEDDDFSDAS